MFEVSCRDKFMVVLQVDGNLGAELECIQVISSFLGLLGYYAGSNWSLLPIKRATKVCS